jgi:N-methylhydantoinase B
MSDGTESRGDPVEVELIRNGFRAAAEEASAALYRSAHSPIIYEAKDCSVGVYDRDARLLGQAPGLPIFLGNLEGCIRAVTERVGLDSYRDGDVFILNDSYLQGSHLTDITVLAPIFFSGRLVAFTATRADGGHLGGKDLGISTNTRHIYEEGLRIPPLRLVSAGVLNEGLVDLLALNSLDHTARRGDLAAQIAACRTGGARVRALYRRYGAARIGAAAAEIFRQSQRLDAEAVRAIPDGVYRAEGHLDGDGVDDGPVPVRVTVTIAGDRFDVDLTGSSPQRRGPVNSGRIQAVSACRLAFKELVNPNAEVTGGSFRNLGVTVPAGSVFDAREPAPCQWYYSPLGLLIDLVQAALAPAVPERVSAAHFGDTMLVSFVGPADSGRTPFVYIGAELGGWGGFAGGDGQDCMINVINGDFKTLPVEFVERGFPLRVREWRLRPDSEGAGEFRGGLGGIKTFEVLREGTRLSAWLDRSTMPAWGLFGGESATGPQVVVNPGRPGERSFTKVTDFELHAGDLVSVRTGGGGGYGDPRRRSAQAVRRDVAEGLVGPERATAVYGLDGEAPGRGEASR